MTSIITGDVINSREAEEEVWLNALKERLSVFGKTPATWEIYRGDSFQVEIDKPEESLLAAICIKAGLKSIKAIDVRMTIGIGEKNYHANKITESNGEAFINSGEKFENLKKLRQNLAIKTPWPAIDTQLNLMLSLASIIMDNWSPLSAELVLLSLQNQQLSQKELGDKLGRTQSSISERQTRANYNEILALELYFRNTIKQQLT